MIIIESLTKPKQVYQTLRLFLFSLLFALSSQPTISYAKDYMVEVVLFMNNTAARSTESHNYRPPQPMKSGSNTWLLKPSMLVEHVANLQDSPDYQVYHHFSWGQEALRFQDSATYAIAERDTQGWIKVYADHLLFANIDLEFNGYRMTEKRRLKLNEMHYFDHPKFGLLMRVSRLEAEQELNDELPEDALESNR